MATKPIETAPQQAPKDILDSQHALQLRYAFGYRSDFKNNIMSPESSKVVYPVGHNLAVLSLENKGNQKFIHGTPGALAITATTMSRDGRFLAFAEELPQAAVITICEYKQERQRGGAKQHEKEDRKDGGKDHKDKAQASRDRNYEKKKSFLSTDFQSKRFVSLEFDPRNQEKYLLSLTSDPEWMIIYWDYSKNPVKLISYFPIGGIEKCYFATFVPHTSEITVLLLGRSKYITYKYGGSEKFSKKDEGFLKKDLKDQHVYSTNYISYAWMGENLIIGTDNGELLYVASNNELKSVLASSPMDGWSIECIRPLKKGFVVGGPDASIYIFDEQRNDLKNPYVRYDRKIKYDKSDSKVVSLSVTENEDYLIFGLEDGSLLQFSLNFDRTNIDEVIKPEPVLHFFHTKQITGLDVCVRKPLLATCSVDKTVKIWNYKDFTLEINKEFEEEAYCISIHPSGFQLVCGFKDKIRMCNILHNDIVPFKEISIKNCREVQFTHGGERFAICNGQNIHIYNSFIGDNPSSYIYREHNGLVQQIYWHEDDLGFLSAGLDGNIFDWRIEDNINKVHLMNQGQLVINSICADYKNKNLYAACSNTTLYEIKIQKPDQKNDLMLDPRKSKIPEPNAIKSQVVLSQITMSNSGKFFFMGTGEKYLPGSIRYKRVPLETSDQVYEIFIHSKPILKMKIAYNDECLFTVGEDGVLAIMELRDDLQTKNQKDSAQAELNDDDFLISKEEYFQYQKKIDKYRKQIQDLNITYAIKKETENRERDDIKKKIEKEINLQQDHEKQRQDELHKQLGEQKRKMEDDQILMDKNHAALKKRKDNEHKEAIRKENERLEEIKKEIELEKKQYDEYVEFFQKNQEKILLAKKEAYQQKLEEEQRHKRQIEEEKRETTTNFDGKRTNIEDQADTNIDQLKEENEIEMKNIQKEVHDAESRKIEMDKDLKKQQTVIEEHKTKLKEIYDEIQQINETNNNLKKERDQQENEIKERVLTIEEKRKRIKELMKKTQELEKFKFVLDYKIKELKRDIGPREEEIAKMKEQINNMNGEILHFKRTNKNLQLIVSDLNLRQKGMQKEIENQTKTYEENAKYIKSFENDLSETYSVVTDYKKLKKHVLKLYDNYVQNANKKADSNVDIQKEFINQRSYLETSVKNLKEKFEKNMEVHHQDNLRIMKENVDLIREINDLKRDRKIQLDEKKQNQYKKKKMAMQELEDLDMTIQKNLQEMDKLENELKKEQNINASLKARPGSNANRLPPLGQH